MWGLDVACWGCNRREQALYISPWSVWGGGGGVDVDIEVWWGGGGGPGFLREKNCSTEIFLKPIGLSSLVPILVQGRIRGGGGGLGLKV